MDPEGRFIVATGAAGGIGGALVRALLKRAALSVITADLDGGGRQANHDTALSDAA
jgi:NAD(P)-dependent dehydrogenase (short-subunit alcohol dehydrogenase family)